MALVPSEVAPILNKVASALKSRGETVAVAESAAGGLISAYLLSVPGASAYYRGGAVLYSLESRKAWAGYTPESIKSYGGPTPQGAIDIAREVGKTLQATWAIGETGVAGPSKTYTGSRHIDAGFCCFGIVGPVEKGAEYSSGVEARDQNMILFAKRALEVFAEALDEAPSK